MQWGIHCLHALPGCTVPGLPWHLPGSCNLGLAWPACAPVVVCKCNVRIISSTNVRKEPSCTPLCCMRCPERMMQSFSKPPLPDEDAPSSARTCRVSDHAPCPCERMQRHAQAIQGLGVERGCGPLGQEGGRGFCEFGCTWTNVPCQCL